MGTYVVVARFDDQTDKKLINLQKTLVENGYVVPEWPPHITIAAYENFDEKTICDWTSTFSQKHKKTEVLLNSLSILPPGDEHTETAVVCLAPSHSKAFIDFYYEFHDKYEEYCTGIGWYNSISHGNPVIHATVGIFSKEKLQSAINLIFQSNFFGSAKIVALEVYSYPMKLIERYELV